MLKTPEKPVLTALARMARSAEWEAISQWLRDSREACVQASLNSDPAVCRKHQGAFQVIDELMTHTRAAEEIASRR